MRVKLSSFQWLVLSLIVIGSVLTIQRHWVAEVPWAPGKMQRVWSLEARITFDALGDSVRASFAIPSSQPGYELFAERTASPGYGLGYVESSSGRRAEWSTRGATGPQTLYYQADVATKDFSGAFTSTPPAVYKKPFSGPEGTAALAMLERAENRSADTLSLTRELFSEFESDAQQAQLLLKSAPKQQWLVDLLHFAEVPARVVKVLMLEDGRRRQRLRYYIQVFAGDTYSLFDAVTGEPGEQKEIILWEAYGEPLFDLVGGENSRVSFSMIAKDVPVKRIIRQQDLSESGILNFSLHSLPLEEQAVFKGILLIPVGVLVVVFMRIFVGLRTSGTFMPVLIALCFIQTSLAVGLIGFIVIVSVGLMIRHYLSRHNLLLVARISTVIIFVILIIAALAILSFQLGLSEGLKITFFPMIILSWTIERMSILWEEEGPKEVFVQAGGSLLVALLAYLVMDSTLVKHLTFNFIGLQLILMALVLSCGSYTGYRLLELKRFQTFWKTDTSA